VVLAGDGRIVTALAAVQGVRDLRVVYPDGRLVRARVGAVDTPWGIAVLEGVGARWPEGLTLAEHDGRSGDAASWIPAAGARPVVGVLARRRSLVGAEGALLRDAWEIMPIAPRSAVGAGVVHVRTGMLVGVIVAPVGDAISTGAEGPFAVPASVIRTVLRRAMENDRPWLGLVAREVRIGEDPMLAAGGLRVIEVQPGSPAQRAGLIAGERGDVVVSVEGRPVARLEDLSAAMEGRRPGDIVTLQVMRRNGVVTMPVRLEALPTH
jgi:2-alkenal reductase